MAVGRLLPAISFGFGNKSPSGVRGLRTIGVKRRGERERHQRQPVNKMV